MPANTHPLPHGSRVALTGLRDACDRLDDAQRGYRAAKQSADHISTSLSETLFWIAALDEHAWKGAVPNYEQRRAVEQGGPAVGGLCYARNFHTHDLITAGQQAEELVFLQPQRGGTTSRVVGPTLAIELQWTALANLPKPKRQERHHRDAMYEDTVELRPLSQPVTDAVAWLQKLPW